MARKKRDAQSPAAAASNGGKADPAASKKKRKRNRSAKEDAIAAKRAEAMKAALDYRRQGYGYQAIADELKISVSTAHKYVTEAIAAIPAEAANDARSMMIDRLDEMLTKCSDELDQVEGQARFGVYDMMLKIEDRRARLLGLYQDRGVGFSATFGVGGGDEDVMAPKRLSADKPVILRIEAGAHIPANPIL